jgi:pimeloyl-ACP methyl ester carboxylesterase
VRVVKKGFKVLGIFLLILLAALLVIPLVVPFPAFPGEIGIDLLKDPDSQFIRIAGLNIHYKQAGSGQTAILLLHGFGASTFSWREVIQPLARFGTVIAYDRPAFGLTDRPMPGEWTGRSPYSLEAQVDQLIDLMDAKGFQKAVLVGNSAGGAVSVYTALKYPQRVQALVLVDAAIYSGGGLPQSLKPLLSTPQGRWYGPLLVRSIQTSGIELLRTAWHDPSRTPPETIAGYSKSLQVVNWDRALWELSLAQGPSGLESRLAELKMPILVVTGDDDRVVPTTQSLRLARDIPAAQLATLKDCGHVPQEECPDTFMQVIAPFIAGLK